jgi:hypothetical protein
MIIKLFMKICQKQIQIKHIKNYMRYLTLKIPKIKILTSFARIILMIKLFIFWYLYI